MNNKKKKDYGEITFWQSSADMLTGIILILVLVIALLLLYLLYTPKSDDGDLVNGYETEGLYEVWETEGSVRIEETEARDNDDSSSSNNHNSSSNNHETETETERETERESEGDYPGDEEGIKAAVYVEVVDDETGKTIKQEGIDFYLHNENGKTKVLNTYYPDKVTYVKFSTRANGTFFLPEKIMQDTYFMSGINAPEGYDPAENIKFTIDTDHIYDWDDPYLLRIPLAPCKNIIRIQLVDGVTLEKLTGATFDVVAADDVVTLDGTLRYEAGEVVDTIKLDANGYGESKKLYLGDYKLVQTAIPEYYASVPKRFLDVAVEKKDTNLPMEHNLRTTKTKITVVLTDEIMEEPIRDAEFEIENSKTEEKTTITTNDQGKATIEDLDKNTDYVIRQTAAVDDYHMAALPVTVTVNKNGRIDDQMEAKVALTNYQIQVDLALRDKVLGRTIQNRKVMIRNHAGREVESYTSGAAAHHMTNLAAGSYKVYLDGQEESQFEFTVADQSEVQEIVYRIVTWQGVASMILGCVIAVGLLALLIKMLVSILSKKKQKGKRKKKDAPDAKNTK